MNKIKTTIGIFGITVLMVILNYVIVKGFFESLLNVLGGV